MRSGLKRLVAAALLGIALAVGLANPGPERAQQPPAYMAGDPGGVGGTGG